MVFLGAPGIKISVSSGSRRVNLAGTWVRILLGIVFVIAGMR